MRVSVGDLYSALAADPSVQLDPNPASRDNLEWRQSFTLRHTLRTLARDAGDARRARIPACGAPLAESLEAWRDHPRTAPWVVSHRLSAATLAAMDGLALSHGTTRFGVLVAGIGRSFAAFAAASGGMARRAVRLTVATNLRQFTRATRRPAPRNMSSIATLLFDPACNEPFARTLAAAAKEVDRIGWGMAGAMSPPALAILGRLPASWRRALVRKLATQQLTRLGAPAFSTVGRLNEARLRFDDAAPEDALMVGVAAPMPYLVIVGVEYRRTLTLAVAFQADTVAPERMQALLDGIVAEVPEGPAA